jgi:hypothetical protein
MTVDSGIHRWKHWMEIQEVLEDLMLRLSKLECCLKDIQRRRIRIMLEPYVKYINPFKKPKKRFGVFTMLFRSNSFRKTATTE